MAPIPAGSSRRPQVTVVVPLYNRAAEIEATLESIISQDYDGHEIVVVDDGSTDGGPDKVKKFAPLVQLLTQKNQGAGAARNLALSQARGDFLAACDSDDVQLPFRLAAQATVLERDPEIALVFSDMKSWHQGEEITSDTLLRRRWLGPTVRKFETEITEAFGTPQTCQKWGLPVPPEYLERRVFVGHVAPLVTLMHIAWGAVQMSRVKSARAVGGYWEKGRAYEDWVFSGRLAKLWPVAFLDLPTCLYRIHPGQLTGRPRLNTECHLAAILELWRGDPEYYRRNKGVVDRVLGTAYANLGEVDAKEGRWAEAEAHFAQALATYPKLKRTYANLLLAMARRRAPFGLGALLDKKLPKILESGTESRG